MAKIRYRDWNPKLETQKLLLKINAILHEYQSAVTVRQLYYRLVSANVIANNDEEYDRIQDILTKARYAGLIDWNAIEDRNRAAMRDTEWDDARDAVANMCASFRLDRWANQHMYVELWVEKAALAGVLSPICHDYHVTLMVNRGYSSASAMKESAERIIMRSRPNKEMPHGHRPVILYVGDLDPSGEDMARDIQARLLEFGVPPILDVNKIVLTMAQVEKYKPPPNPVKLSDGRAKDYIAKYGVDTSWEADSLPPPVLDLIVRTSLNAYVDKKAMTEAITRENLTKARIKQHFASFKD